MTYTGENLFYQCSNLYQILFKKPPEEVVPVKPQPILKDYGMDPEHRKYVFAEEYANGSERSMREEFNREDRELGVRRKNSGGKGRFQEDKRRLGKPFSCLNR